MLKKSYSAFNRAIAVFLVIILILSEVPLPVYADDTASAGETYCGLEEHVHSEECYENISTLVCGKTEHQHSEQCYIAPEDKSVQPQAADNAAGGSSSVFITDYNNDFIAYNYYCYLNGIGEVTIAGTGYSISGSSNVRSVIIGDQTGDLSDDQSPKTKDIDVTLNGLVLSGSSVFEVRPVYDGANKVVTEVATVSSLNQLRLTENAKMTLAVNADTTITDLTLAENASLSVTVAEGATLRLGTVTGSGKLSLSGTGAVVVSNKVEVGELEISGIDISGEDAESSVTAVDSLTLHSGTVRNLELFGYADSAFGSRTLVLESGNFYDVAAVGVRESNTAVILDISGMTIVGTTNTNVYRDYSITYQYNGSTITGADWPVTYRVKYVNDCTAENAVTVDNRSLPQYTLAGYVFTGWLLGETTLLELPASGMDGALVLAAQMQAGEVGVTFDLGYEPTELTNDKDAEGNLPSKTWTQVSSVGGELALTAPKRFGYEFTGWKITTGENRQLRAEDTSTTIAYSDLTEHEGAYTLKLEAQWEWDTFPVRLQPGIGFNGSISDIQISLDGGHSWESLAELAEQNPHMSWDASSETCSFDIEIEYQESLADFFKRVFGEDSQYPILQDTRTVENGKTRFVCWKTAEGTNLQANDVYDLGEDGFLTKSDSQTLSDFMAHLKVSPLVLGTSWSSTLEYTLTTELPAGWSVLVGGKTDAFAVTPEADGTITVDAAQPVYYRIARSSSERISAWVFAAEQGTAQLYPALETVASGDQYLYYKFIMPNSDVNASYCGGDKTVYVDLSRSPVTLAENISYAGLTDISGFWYNQRMERTSYDGMTVNAMTPLFYTTNKTDSSAYASVTGSEDENSGWYFYEYNWNSKPFYVTSRDVATQNQLTVVNKVSIYLKHCNLTATDSFLEKAVGLNLDGKVFNTSGVNLREYANIIIDRTATNYIPSIVVDGANTVACIANDKFYTDLNHYNTINLSGQTGKDTDKLTLGTVLGNFAVGLRRLTIQQYEKGGSYEDFQAIIAAYKYGDSSINSTMESCVLVAPERAWCGTYRVYFSTSDIELQSFPQNAYQRVSQQTYTNCNVVVHGDVYADHVYSLAGSSKVRIEGNLLMSSQGDTHMPTIDTTGYLIIEGNRAEFANLKMRKGTLICNTLSVSQGSEFSGGTVITNVLSERASTDNTSESNADGYPFGRSVSGSSGTFNFIFSGSKVYLFGHYSTTANGSYDSKLDLTATALTEGNPIKSVVEQYRNGGVYTDAELASAVAAAAEGAQECVSLGRTSYILGSDTHVRNVRITGGAIHAAGNITFYNDTTVSGGTVVTRGSFASKRDLFITGGSVTAAEVGNAYNVTRTEDGIVRWAQTSITGGSVTTNRIGELSATIRGVEARSYVSIATTGVTISPLTAGGSVAVVSDLKVNYHLAEGMILPSTMPTNVRYQCSDYTQGSSLEGQLRLSETNSDAKVTFASLKISETESADWTLDSVSGDIVSFIDNAGHPEGRETSAYVYSPAKSIELYAVREHNTLTIREGENYITRATVTDGEGNMADLTFTNGTASVKSGSTISFTVPAAMKDKVIVAYYDDSQVLYNACTSEPTANADGTYTFRFTMPRTAAEIWVTNWFNLYLNRYSVAFTADGFATEYGTSAGNGNYTFDASRSFSYQGNIRLSEEGAKTERIKAFGTTTGTNDAPLTFTKGSATTNLIHFTRDFDNLSEGKQQREIVLSNLIQTYTEQGAKQTVLEGGAQVRLGIDGHVGLYVVHVPQTANIEIYGVNAGSRTGLDLPDTLWIQGFENYSLGNNNGACGNITLTDLFITQRNGADGGIGCYYGKQTPSSLTMRNCAMKSANYYDGTWIVKGMQNVNLDHCYINLVISPSWPGDLIHYCHSVTLTNGTEYILTYGSEHMGYAPFTVSRDNTDVKAKYKDAVFTIDNSSMSIATTFGSTKGITHGFDWMYDVVLTGSGSLTADRYLSLDTLVMKGSAKVTVGDDSHNGYLFCSDITVEGSAELNAGYIAVSGFYTVVDPSERPYKKQGAQTEDAWRKEVANGTHIRDGGTLTMNGGTVNAKYFVGGDVNGRIIVNGGTLNAPRIGNLGAYLGILSLMPATDTEWCLFYEKVPAAGKAAVVDIYGGTVNVGENGYLGGMNASVNIHGGTVNLANGAVLGMTEAQKTTLADSYSITGDSIANHTDTNCNLAVTGGSVTGTGSINAPYGSVEVSEADADTQVSVKDFTAESGTISIKNACDGIGNPYTSSESDIGEQVGVLVSGTLSAKNLYILEGAAVCADLVYSDVKAGENGVLEVAQDANGDAAHTALYPRSYFGMMGSGEVEYKTIHPNATNEYKKNVYGIKRARILYELCDDAIDPAANDPDNPDGFLTGSYAESGYKITLKDPTRFGFDFDGWYEQADYSGEAITQILTTNSTDIVLYAKWTPRMIPYTVSVSADRVADLASEIAGLDGQITGDVFTFMKTVLVSYRSVLIGTENTGNQLHLVDYNLTTYSVTELAWQNGSAKTVLSSGSSTVDHSMVEAYDASNQPLTLYVNAVAKRRFLVTLNLNLTGGLPKDAKFNNIAAPDQSTSTTISSYLDFGKTYGEAAGFASGNALITPSAPGYTFMGWNTKADGTGETITADEVVSSSSSNNLYAIWQANTYKLTFDAGEDGLVTVGSSAPAASDTQQTITGTVVYDQQIDGNIRYADAGTGAGFPYAWKKGYVFLGWSFGETADSVNLTSQLKLNLTDISSLDLDGETALTLHAVYRRIQVTYNTNGGTWQDSSIGTGKNQVTVNAPKYGEALAGYVKGAALDETGDYVLTGTVSEDNTVYAAYSTTIEGYSKTEVHGYVENDYRETILRKGYTFFGWYTTAEAAQAAAEQGTTGDDFFPASFSGAVGTVPEYEDITLYASWKPNAYSLTLYAGTSEYSEMKQNQVAAGQTVSLRIEDEVKGTYITESDIHWPARSDWYAQTKSNSDDNTKRYLLGFTFDELEPGDSQEDSAGYAAYLKYAAAVTQLIRCNALFYKAEEQTSGTVFYLPEDVNYGSTVISGTNAVPDYPTGYTIPLYAVYRERSLVFIEYVVDANGTPSKTVLASYPYNNYVDYPADYLKTESYQKLTAEGYKLIKWGVNSYGIEAEEYKASTYDANKETYKEIASEMGAFDINVYTVYAAQVTDTAQKLLTATEDPTASNVSTYTYKLPMSMQNGVIYYQLLANDGSAYNGFDLVTKAEMNANRYSSDYRNKIALTMQILDSDGNEVGEEVELASNSGQVLFSNASIGAGYSVRLRMYHSSVMTEDEDVTKTISLKCSFYRNSQGGEDMQQFFWLKNIQTRLVPSMYTVTYNVVLPEDLTVTNWNGFESNGVQTVRTAYGSTLLSAAPEVEGYTPDNTWTRTTADGTAYTGSDSSAAFGANLTFPVSAEDNGKIYLKSTYQIDTYRLTLTTEVLDKWTVQIDGVAVTKGLLSLFTGEKTIDVNYHQTVAFIGKTEEEPAEFVQLTHNGSSLGELDLYAAAGAGNTYTFRMPNHDIDASYEDVKTLYLEDGAIELINSDAGNGYRQDGKTLRTWRGKYRILMDADDNEDGSSTDNRLIVDGDFTGRDISLGKLNIKSNDSIELRSGTTTVSLKATEIQAKNIAVPVGAKLALTSALDTKAELTLTPSNGYAAIGGHNSASGEITLDQLEISMTLPAGSAASGIGARSQDALDGCGVIRLTNCEVVAEEKTTASSAYTGSWIGGETVILENSVLSKRADSASMHGPYVLKCTDATITGSQIGSSTDPVNDPIYASNSLSIDNSEVYQRIEQPLGSTAALGTGEGGTISVKNSTIEASFSASGSTNSLYTGKLMIYDADSSVNIKDTQILDVNNGSVTIEQTRVTQNGKNHAHNGSYLLLNEFQSYNNQSSLTVNGLTGNAKVQTNALTLKDLTANYDTPLYLNGNLTVSGNAGIAAGKTLNVVAGANTFTAGGFDAMGNYTQTGGRLTGTGDLIVGGNMTLDQVTADLSGKKLGSNGAAGVTTVTIQDSAVTAAQVGALGTQSETFTFVVTDSSTITGDLIQDHYRIKYELPNQTYSASGLPTVLRSTTTAGSTTFVPAIPGEPTCSATSMFKNWYYIRLDGTNVVVSQTPVNGFTAYGTLDASCLAHAEETGDGTKTLTLYTWMRLEGKATIQAGNVFKNMETITDASPVSIAVVNNGQWTARFEIQGTVIAGSKYEFTFANPIPAGTRLILCDRGGEELQWYYYTASEAVTTVTTDQFVAMGGSGAPDLPEGSEGEVFDNTLQLTADFSAAVSSADDNTVSMKLLVGSEALDIQETPLSYTVFQAASAAISATDSTISVTVAPGSDNRLNGKKLYAVAVIQNAAQQTVSTPYGASAICGASTGTWIGGSTIAFDLGDYKAVNAESRNWTISGLPAGDYLVTWYLTAAEDPMNPFDSVLAQAASIQLHQDAIALPSMTAALAGVDGAATNSQVLTAGSAHTVTFTVETNQSAVAYWVEKQAALKKFTVVSGSDGTASGSKSTVTVTIPGDAGTYRVRFSIKGTSEWDDVYYSFIVK